MDKQQRMKQLIMDELVIKATSPWDGEARFDSYSVVVHKYDGEDLGLMNDNDPRITNAAERILQLIDPAQWDQLIAFYCSVETYTQSDGERKPIARGKRLYNDY